MIMWFELVLAMVSLILGAAISQQQMEDQNSRSAHDTQVRGWYDAVKSRFGVTQDQLNQKANKMDIDLTRLADAARGSARLSRASEKYRAFTRQYPEKIAKINQTKNVIQNAINNLSSKQESMSSAIQQGKTVSKYDVAKDVKDNVDEANEAINDMNTSLTQTPEQERTSTIDTDLTTVQGEPKQNKPRSSDFKIFAS